MNLIELKLYKEKRFVRIIKLKISVLDPKHTFRRWLLSNDFGSRILMSEDKNSSTDEKIKVIAISLPHSFVPGNHIESSAV